MMSQAPASTDWRMLKEKYILYYMTWEELDREITKLRDKIDYKPDFLVGIVRGGVIPARLLSDKMTVREMYGLTIKKNDAVRTVTSDITENISGRKALLLEDMLESGKSLIEAKRYLEKKGALVKTACLYIMDKTEIQPDFFLRTSTGDEKFPWEQEVPTPLNKTAV